MTATAAPPSALEVVVLARISELWRWRSWYRVTPYAAEWTDLRRGQPSSIEDPVDGSRIFIHRRATS